MKNKHVKRVNLLLSILLGAGVFIFFGVYYPYHLHYQEQFQMFLFTSGYFVERVSHPGGVADYLGNFLTQFYYYSWAGAAVLAGVLWGMQRLVAFIAGRMGECSLWQPHNIPAGNDLPGNRNMAGRLRLTKLWTDTGSASAIDQRQ